MEFKIRLTRKKKSRAATHKRDSGYVRVKIRGRKRWVKVGKKSATAKSVAAKPVAVKPVVTKSSTAKKK